MKRLLILMALPLVFATACNERKETRETPFAELETEDIAPPIDAELSTAEDERGRVRAEEISGVLPEGFPADAPLFTPSSVVDFGALGGGRYFVAFDTMAPLEEVRRTLLSRLGSQGWTPSANKEYTKSPHRIRVEFKEMSPGTRIRYEFGE